jgi:transcriptional regulator with XRE-family HTH domain
MPLNIAKQFGANLLLARKRAGLSQEEVAWLASLHRTEIGLLERGERTPRIDTLVKLTCGLSISPEELLAGIDWQPGTVERGSFSVAPSRGGD